METKKWGWADLPCDILELILGKLHFTAQIRFAAVCRIWRGASEKCTSTSSSYRLPWLINVSMYYPFGCKLFDPYSEKSYTVSNPITYEHPISSFGPTRVYASKSGWLLLGRQRLYRRDHGSTLFFHNTFSNDVIFLPDLGFDFAKATFTTNPTFPECQVFVVRQCYKTSGFVHNIYNICLSKDRVWSEGTPHISTYEVMNMHYMKGKVYCLFMRGLLKSYTVANKSWESLTPGLPADNRDLLRPRCWLIEIGENLVSAYMRFEPYNEYKFLVFKFDWSRMNWILETSLKNTTLFVSGDISYSAPLIDDVHGRENLEEDCKMYNFDTGDCYINEEYRPIYSKCNWIDMELNDVNFIEPPYVRN